MLLVIDAGNTNVVFAAHDGKAWVGKWRIATDDSRTADEYAVWVLTLMQLAGLAHARFDRAVIGTVVPAALFHLRRFCRDWLGVEPLVAQASLNWGVEIATDNPDEVGADRLLNALAGQTLHGGPFVVVDFGTATTFDVVDDRGAFLGGVIAPGANLSLDALHKAAARLPRMGIGRPADVIGRSTMPAMRSGIFWGYIGLVEGIVSRIKAEYGAPMKVIATGGLAPLFAEGTDILDHVDEDLTLEGLRLLAQRNPLPTWTDTVSTAAPTSRADSAPGAATSSGAKRRKSDPIGVSSRLPEEGVRRR
ncbi:type III pantothenate kinase [Endobacter medicaginis]|uniref:Type III pantothenate kinase n=1 Tax=Endobacter medicaginis TaxID=1181271 RepID=A0A839UXM9_9PROT|nr:type III pantothenate kinase [Endobacter medicaginis]NVN28891.1 type III pantothenate kinase [Endobacter medicaginis]